MNSQNSMRIELKNIKDKKIKQRQKSKFHKTQQAQQQQQQRQAAQTLNVLTNFLGKHKKKRMKDILMKYYGKNFPVQYKQDYDFQQQWQNKMFFDFKKLKSLVNQQNFLEVILLLLTVITYSLTIWLSTIDTYFARQIYMPCAQYFSCITLLVHVIRTLLEIKQYVKLKRVQLNVLYLMNQYKDAIIILVYLTMKIFQSQIFLKNNSFFVIYQIVSLILMYSTAKKVYQSIRYMDFPLRHQYQTKIIDMLVTIFIIAHVISLAMIQTTKLNPQTNWMTHLKLENNQYWAKYVYTYYFTTTTILTVGYGDITPKNPAEVIIVVLVEIFGIVIFGYVMNQIGYCISSLKKSRQVIDKDLAIIQKIKRQYMMDHSSVNKMVSFVINNKETNDKLTPDQQKNVLMKLNDEIRQDIMKQNFLNILKKSVFFLCRWSKYFQNNIAMKLNHALYNPNDILSQIKHKQKIYIIKSGKINIHADRSDGKKKMGMLLKTIENTKQNENLDNVYGYTAAISDRPFNLYAISKDFTSAYYIEKSDFVECAKQKVYDFQYYHEIKAKINQSVISQAFQAELLQSNRHHYNPSKIFLLKKFNNSKICNKRRSFNRFTRTIPKGKYLYVNQVADKIRDVFVSSIKELQLSDQVDVINQPTIVKTRRNTSLEDIDNPITQSKSSLIINDLLNSKNKNFQAYFQSSKQYQNYFSRKNISIVLQKYENQLINFSSKNKKN